MVNIMVFEISIIIVSYNNENVLRQTIVSLLQQINFNDVEIVVVDNASTENNVEMIKKDFPQIKLIENKENVGFGRANNQGATIAKGEFLFFVNGDVILKGNPFIEMISIYKKNRNVGLLGAQLINIDSSLQPSHYNFPSITKRIIELLGFKKFFLRFYSTNKVNTTTFFRINVVKGAFFLVKKDLFKKLGGFDDYYFMYIEDIDLSYKAIKEGYHNYLYNCRDIIHLGWNIETILNEFTFFNRNRGLIYFYKKNHFKLIYYLFITINFILLGIKLLYYNCLTTQEEPRKVLEKVWLMYAKAFNK